MASLDDNQQLGEIVGTHIQQQSQSKSQASKRSEEKFVDEIKELVP